MWFLFIMGLCLAVLMIMGTVFCVVFAIGLIKLMIDDIKNGKIKRW